MSDWIRNTSHLFFIFGSLLAVLLAHAVIRSLSTMILDRRRLDLSDSMWAEVFGPASRNLTSDEIRQKYVQSFFWSIVYYIFFDVLIGSGVAAPSVMGRVTIAKIAGLTVVALIPFISMQLSSRWIPIRRITSLLIGGALLTLTFETLHWKGFLGQWKLPSHHFDAAPLFRHLPNHLPAFSLQLDALLISIVCAALLVLLLRYDLRFDKTIEPDFYRAFPWRSKAASLLKETVKIFVPALLVGYGALKCWPLISRLFGWPAFGAVSNTGLRPSQADANATYWALVIASVLGISALKSLRLLTDSYDAFVSYKSVNATLARNISEQLMASGVKIWFAEYELLIQDQLEIRKSPTGLGEKLIEKAIRRGVRSSKYGLALTNDSYVESTYCGFEIAQLLKKCGTKRIFEIMIPKERRPHREIEGLSKCRSIEYKGKLNEVILFLAEGTGGKLPEADPRLTDTAYSGDGQSTYEEMCLGSPFTLNTFGWDLTDPGGAVLGAGSKQGPELQREAFGQTLHVNLYFGREEEAAATNSRLNSNLNDRQTYDYLIAYARKHLARLDSEVRGVHLLRHGGFSQFAMTYQFKGMWMRKYSLILANPNSGKIAEFAFTFCAPAASFPEFCRCAYLMDDLVSTLQWN